jgi:hypothetical protein
MEDGVFSGKWENAGLWASGAAVALYGWPGFLVGGHCTAAETEKAIASVENASITLCGVRIDVNPLNLIGGEKELIVSRKKQSANEATGLTSSVVFGLDYGVQAAGEYKEATNRAIYDQYYKDYAKFDEQY